MENGNDEDRNLDVGVGFDGDLCVGVKPREDDQAHDGKGGSASIHGPGNDAIHGACSRLLSKTARGGVT